MPAAAPKLRIALLGPFRVERDGGEVAISVRKGRALLAELALRAGRRVPREELVARLWPESDDERGRDSFRHVLWRLRAELGTAADAIGSHGDDLRLGEEVAVDVRDFEGAARDPDRLAEALGLYRGDLCKELEGDEAEAERTRLRGLLGDVGRRLGEQQLAAGDAAAAISTARTVLRHDPYREDAYRLVLQGHARAGDAAALAAEYRRLTALLRTELGVDPSSETRALYARLVTDQPPEAPHARVRRPRTDVPSALFGRREELGPLIQLLGDAIDRRGRAVLVTGEAGAGKTALLGEVARVAREHGFTVVEARAVGAEGQLAYQVWRDALRPHDRTAAAMPAPWSDVLSALLPTHGTGSATVASAPEHERARLFEGVSRLLSALAASAPVALLIDDVHWLEADSLQLLAHVVRVLRGERVAVISAARPVDPATSPTLVGICAELGASGLCAELEVGSLGGEAVGELLRDSGVAATTVTWLAPRMAAWTAGNPFFVLEATRALAEQGALLPSDAGLAWSVKLPTEAEPLASQLPTGVRQTVLGRIGVLPTETRQLLNVAAAVGRVVVPELLAATTGRDELAVVEALAPALQARLMREETLDGRPALAFTHDLVREATYQHMPSVMRAAIHRRVALALEERGAPSVTLAHHFTAASDPDRAAPYLVAAAVQAERAFAHDEALRAYRAALSMIAGRSAMKVDPARHRAQPWRVHTLAPDFELIDVWHIPIEADPARGETFDQFIEIVLENKFETGSAVVRALVSARGAVGRALGWEREDLIVPGSSERSVSERLSDDDRRAERPSGPRIIETTMGRARLVYRFADEALIELSDATVAALLHFGWVDLPSGKKTAEAAVYIKSRGLRSRAYMALIQPFRGWLIFPAWTAHVARLWRERQAAGGPIAG